MNKLNVIRGLVYAQAVGAGVISFMHIVEVGYRFGIGWQSWVAPFLIDGFAMLGIIGRNAKDKATGLHAFSERARRAGLGLSVGAGLVSLACNVTAGSNIGQMVFGGVVVAGFVTAEWYGSTLDSAPAVKRAEVSDEIKARRSAAAVKAAATRKRNAEAIAKADRKALREARRQLVDAGSIEA